MSPQWLTESMGWAVVLQLPGLDTPLPDPDPIVVRDVVSPWTFVSLSALTAVSTAALILGGLANRRRRTGPRHPGGPDREENQEEP